MSGPVNGWIGTNALLMDDLDRGEPHRYQTPPSPYNYKKGCRCHDCRKAELARSRRSKRKHGILPPRPIRGHLPKALVTARTVEGRRRRELARSRAFQALRDAHPAEYEALYAEFIDMIAASEGPLPGDDWYQPSDS